MLRQLVRRGQLTIPTEYLKKFGLHEKDYVEVSLRDVGIFIQPVSIVDYSQTELETLRKKLDKLPRGQKKIFHSVEQSQSHLDALKSK